MRGSGVCQRGAGYLRAAEINAGTRTRAGWGVGRVAIPPVGFVHLGAQLAGDANAQLHEAGAAVDSVVFPALAFGAMLPLIVVGQFGAKVLGGAAWSLVLRR